MSKDSYLMLACPDRRFETKTFFFLIDVGVFLHEQAFLFPVSIKAVTHEHARASLIQFLSLGSVCARACKLLYVYAYVCMYD